MQLKPRVRRTLDAVRRAARHPSWFVGTIQGARRRRRQDKSFTLARHAACVTDLGGGLRATLNLTDDVVAAELAETWWPGAAADHQGASPELASVMRVVVRVVRPERVVETGVAQGITSAVTLQAMADNGLGHLVSIDLPPLGATPGYVGSLVPERLRGRWTLLTGPSSELLPGVMRERMADVFVHDADHTYEAQIQEYQTAWPALRPGGMLVSDDVRNEAFFDFARSVGLNPTIIGRVSDLSGVGLLRKPG
jgi:Methyltransferase domain